MELKDKKCDCSTGNVQRLSSESIDELLSKVHGWAVVEESHPNQQRKQYLNKHYRFPDFLSSVLFVQQLASVAEEQNHHPRIIIDYKKVTVEIYTHVVKALTENDFILAAKYDEIKR